MVLEDAFNQGHGPTCEFDRMVLVIIVVVVWVPTRELEDDNCFIRIAIPTAAASFF